MYAYEIHFKVLANNFDVEDYLEKFFLLKFRNQFFRLSYCNFVWTNY